LAVVELMDVTVGGVAIGVALEDAAEALEVPAPFVAVVENL
jgi:hypothetical protein